MEGVLLGIVYPESFDNPFLSLTAGRHFSRITQIPCRAFQTMSGRQVHTRKRLLYALFTRTIYFFKSPIKDTMDEAKQYECMAQELGPDILSRL
jgi:hypothetical protein